MKICSFTVTGYARISTTINHKTNLNHSADVYQVWLAVIHCSILLNLQPQEWWVQFCITSCCVEMGAVRITPSYPKFNGSRFGLPPSSIHKMAGLGGKMVWTMMYAHRPHFGCSMVKTAMHWITLCGYSEFQWSVQYCITSCRSDNWQVQSKVNEDLADQPSTYFSCDGVFTWFHRQCIFSFSFFFFHLRRVGKILFSWPKDSGWKRWIIISSLSSSKQWSVIPNRERCSNPRAGRAVQDWSCTQSFALLKVSPLVIDLQEQWRSKTRRGTLSTAKLWVRPNIQTSILRFRQNNFKLWPLSVRIFQFLLM